MLIQGRNSCGFDDVAFVAYRHLKAWLDDVCVRVATKFGLFDRNGRPRKAPVLDALLRHSCLGCIVKDLTQLRGGEVDALYRENHRLAVNLLIERLRARLSAGGGSAVEGEVSGEYGRVDVLIKPLSCGILIELGDFQIVVEVKTGRGLSYAQILRYLIERPHAVIVVWRVSMRQVLIIRGREHLGLTLACMDMAIRRGLALLNNEVRECSHKRSRGEYRLENPQETFEKFTASLVEGLPAVVDAVLNELEVLKAEVRGVKA